MIKLKVIVLLMVLLMLSCGVSLVNNDEMDETGAPVVQITPKGKEVTVINIRGGVDRDWLKLFEEAFENKKTAVVLAIVNSNGGSVIESKLVCQGLRELRLKYKKPLFIYSDGGLYSGAYWAVLPANGIIIAPSGMVGSIGVIALRKDYTVSDSIAGVKMHMFKSGKLKGLWHSHVKLSEAYARELQRQIDYIYAEFITQILYYRGNRIGAMVWPFIKGPKSSEFIRNWLEGICDGRAYFPQEALQHGLIDGVDYYSDLVKSLKEVDSEFEFKDLKGKKLGSNMPKVKKFKGIKHAEEGCMFMEKK